MASSQRSESYYILYQDDHQKRAHALAPAKSQLVSLPAKAVTGLDTLVVKRWRSSNKKIDTIEILTCNSRHAPSGSDP